MLNACTSPRQSVNDAKVHHANHPEEGKQSRKIISKPQYRHSLIVISLIAATFLTAAVIANGLNQEGNTGAKVAEAASRVNHQLDDTQAAFTDIRELIPEERQRGAALPNGYSQEATGWQSPPREPQPPTTGSNPPMPPIAGNAGDQAGDQVSDGIAVVSGIAQADDGHPGNPVSSGEPDPENGSDEKQMPATQRFNGKAREIQGDKMLAQHQANVDRSVDNRYPPY